MTKTTCQELSLPQRERIQKAFEDYGLSLVFKTGIVDVVEKVFFSTTLSKNYATFMYHSKATIGLGYAFSLIEYRFEDEKVEIMTNSRYPDTNPLNVYLLRSKAYREMARIIDDVKQRDEEIRLLVLQENQTKSE
ncbi:hypothetical protein GLOIN_2v1500972 [Rhizophagus clarus]|uniref:Uncharacterized protein n=1 Tax=Rhizophagus clarus TaxID=94130 RepID=A0A8H3MJX3_9GLOM|nr:hypothetical protein GLOIN_2v1500972 [Rhizophagus clarus]